MFLLLWIFVQIITESLPISSSGHVTLLQQLFNMHFDPSVTMLIQFVLHIPALFILLSYFFKSWWSMIFSSKNIRDIMHVALFIAIADLITIFFWYIDLTHWFIINQYFLPVGFGVTALCLYVTRNYHNNKSLQWLCSDAIILGIVQGLSLLPGISRFASTYSAGLILGYSRWNSFCISFLIQFPLVCAAVLKGCLVMYHNHELLYQFLSLPMICYVTLITLCSYIVFSYVAILIIQNRLWYFAPYMIIPISLSLWLCKG